VIGVREEFSVAETWPFECLQCLRVWAEDYVARHGSDGHGNDVVVWLSRGVTVQPPLSGTVCPSCGCAAVSAFPSGYLAGLRNGAGRLERGGDAGRLELDGRLASADPFEPAEAPTVPDLMGPGVVGPATTMPDLELDTPGLTATAPMRPVAGRARTPYVLYTVLAISLLLFVSFGLYD
jgi:hypothetical protein